MTDNWRIIDLKTHSTLSEVFTDIDAVKDRIKMLEEAVPDALLIPQMIMVPDKRFSIYFRESPEIDLGYEFKWHLVTDADTIAEAVERILNDLDLNPHAADPDCPEEYKITFTDHPDMVVLQLKPGKFYPTLEEDES